ncbi:MAG: 4Fe-4S dicluster domain-containing protein [Promethearchaeota archaeon]
MKTVYVRPERCIGCKQCEIACTVEHSRTKNLYSAIFEEPLPTPRVAVMPTFGIMTYPAKCRHCDPTPCIQVCPSGAITRDKETDTILLNEEKCIACGMCSIVCPFDAVTFYPSWHVSIDRQVAIKCDNCSERVINGLNPACVDACKTEALVYGEISDIVKEGRKIVAKKVAAAEFAAEAKIEAEVPELLTLLRDMSLSMKLAGEKE